MTRYDVINKEIVEEGDGWRIEVQLCTVKEWNRPHIRVAYYKIISNPRTGSKYWNLVLRPASFELESADKVAEAIQRMRDSWKETAKIAIACESNE